MNLYRQLAARDTPVRCAVIGCGKFATMFLSQARLLPNLQVAAVADLSTERAEVALAEAGYAEERIGADSVHEATSTGATYVTEDAGELLGDNPIDVVVEATGNPGVATEHAYAALTGGQHVVMVSVVAVVLVGPALTALARRNGLVYSMAYGDQPALICEMVDWAHTVGLRVVAAGKGTKYLPDYHFSTPDTVWQHYGLSADAAQTARLNPTMFNSFLDGTKSAIEMAAVANATGLAAPADGLRFPPAGTDQLAEVCIPASAGGVLDTAGTVEVVSSLHRDGTDVANDLRWGVYVTLEAPTDYVAGCFAQYGVATDPTGRFAAMYRPYHLIGLELAVSVVGAAVTGQPTGAAERLVADVVATAKRDLRAGEQLDGEGGYTVYGRLTTIERSHSRALLPMGLAQGARLRRSVPHGMPVGLDDVDLPASQGLAGRLRRELLEASA